MYEASQKTDKPNYTYHVVFIGISFMVLFSGYLVAQNLISDIYKQVGYTNLGRICVALIHIAFGIGSMFAPHYSKKLSAKKGLFAGALTYLTFILTGVLATYCHKYDLQVGFCSDFSIYFWNLLFGIILGFGGAMLWLCQASYVNDCTNETNKGTMIGIFQSLMQCSLIVGSLMAAFILGSIDEFTYFLLVSIVIIIAIIMLLFLPALSPKQGQLSKQQKPLRESIKAFFDVYRNPAHYPVIISCFFTGIVMSFYTTYFPTVVRMTVQNETGNTINQRISFAILNLGAGEMLSGYTVGRLLDRFPNFKISDYILGCTELTLIMTFLAVETESYTLSLIVGFLWGLSDNAAKTMTINLISAKFNGKLELFAQYRTTQAIGVVIGSLGTILLSDLIGSFFVLIVLGSIVCCHLLFNLTLSNMNKTPLGVELLEKQSFHRKISQ